MRAQDGTSMDVWKFRGLDPTWWPPAPLRAGLDPVGPQCSREQLHPAHPDSIGVGSRVRLCRRHPARWGSCGFFGGGGWSTPAVSDTDGHGAEPDRLTMKLIRRPQPRFSQRGPAPFAAHALRESSMAQVVVLFAGAVVSPPGRALRGRCGRRLVLDQQPSDAACRGRCGARRRGLAAKPSPLPHIRSPVPRRRRTVTRTVPAA